MKCKQRNFSPREQQLIDVFIRRIFHIQRISDCSGELYQCAWEAFLGVYRDNPVAFSYSGLRGWRKAYLIIWDAVTEAKKQNNFWLCRQSSLDQPVSCEVPDSRVQLLRAPHSDFQNSVCFHDYLQRMDKDLCRTAYCLIDGSSIDEIQLYYGWTNSYMCQVYYSLRAKMKEYLDI